MNIVEKRAKQAAYMREWVRKNPDRKAASDKKYRDKDPETYKRKMRKRQKEWTEEQRQQNRNYQKQWKKENPEKAKAIRLRTRFGIDMPEYEALLKTQRGRCAICKEKPKATSPQNLSLHVDHNHTTGKVRGLLCGPCNRGIGLFRDSKKLVAQALAYL